MKNTSILKRFIFSQYTSAVIILFFFLISNIAIAQTRNDLHELVGNAFVDYTNTINQRFTQYFSNPVYFNNTHAVKIRYDSVNRKCDVYIQKFFLKSEIDTLNYDLIYFNGHFFYLIKEGNDNHMFFDNYYFVNEGMIHTINSVIFQDDMIAHYGIAIGYIVCIYHYRIDLKNWNEELIRIAPANQLNKELWPIKNLNSYFQIAITDELTIKMPKSDRKGRKESEKMLKTELKDINVWQPIPKGIY